MQCTRQILSIKDDKRISEWIRKDIELIYKVIAEADYHLIIPLLQWAASRRGAVVTECSCKAKR